MNRRALLTATFAVLGAKSIDKAVALAFEELDVNERYAVWLCTGTDDGKPVADAVLDCIPELVERGHLKRYELPENHWARSAWGVTHYHKATTKGRRTLDRMGFDSDRDAYMKTGSTEVA
jgi:hypothetical protein